MPIHLVIIGIMLVEILMMLTSISLDMLPVAAIENDPTTETASSFQSSEKTTSNNDDTLVNTMWALDILNYSVTSGQFLISSLYDHNVYYLNSMKDNVKLFYHYLLARVFSLFVPPKSARESSETILSMSRLSSPIHPSAITYHLYKLQSILFRTETVAILCIFLILTIFIHSLFHYRERQSSTDIRLSHSSPSIPTRIFSTLFSYLNFTLLFPNFRANESVTIQVNYGQAGVYSIQGRRPNMEDCFSLRNNVSKDLGIDYYAVFDGHGGPNAALFAEKEIFAGVSKRIKQIFLNSTKENELVVPKESVESCPKSKPSSLQSSSCSYNSKDGSKFFQAKEKQSHILNELSATTIKNILHEEIVQTDKYLLEKFRKKSDISGTTALIAVRIISTNTLLVANVGDSRGILCDWKGATIPLSFDHKPYQLKEYLRIIQAGGYISYKGVYRVNGILAVSRALGDYPLKEDRLVIPDPDILSFDLNELNPRFIIMASDGFWDTFSNVNAVEFVRNELIRYSGYNKEANITSNVALQIAKKLVNEAYVRESYDNITVIVILFDDDVKGKSSVSKRTKLV